ncbi:helix-turn-helix domain-containing protein [Arthrobacter sp. GMC3]|uniref:helix-turn-helix domain-containing protein n=1 Tax=Arthrobacter sp. GMC3 TaxID=2058894 RepID=UPI000CE54427|nr:helix-turn-helix domain-containing protein [Arthrobacter sp. GMC3]
MPTLWTPEELALFLNVSTQELSVMRCDGTGPAFSKFRRNIRYNPRQVSEWLESNTRTTTKEASNG